MPDGSIIGRRSMFDWATLLNLGKGQGLIVDLDKRVITIKFPFLEIGPISFLSAIDITKDPVIVEDILSRLFVSKQAMWFDFQAEVVEAVKQSIADFQKECTKIQNGEKKAKGGYVILKSLAAAAANEATLFMKDVARFEADEARDREDFRKFIILSSDDIIEAKPRILERLGALRSGAYPMFDFLVDCLPDTSAVKMQARDILIRGRELLNLADTKPVIEFS
jgi:hypothetical protein